MQRREVRNKISALLLRAVARLRFPIGNRQRDGAGILEIDAKWKLPIVDDWVLSITVAARDQGVAGGQMCSTAQMRDFSVIDNSKSSRIMWLGSGERNSWIRRSQTGQ